MTKVYTSKELIKIVEDDGWYLVQVHGSHHKFKHATKKGIVVIPHPKSVTPIGTANNILRQAGLK
ncbi:MAG: type II toxin-antitoxin system HicA family toxin [Leptospirales bacterium]|nr:type II toxin-antitoxin system HicA family toxin [Leptospirales bacterium]